MKEIPLRIELYKNSSLLDAYISNCLVPIVRGTSNNMNLIAWEIINEPEWMIEN